MGFLVPPPSHLVTVPSGQVWARVRGHVAVWSGFPPAETDTLSLRAAGGSGLRGASPGLCLARLFLLDAGSMPTLPFSINDSVKQVREA